jgi:hypothetical protein
MGTLIKARSAGPAAQCQRAVLAKVFDIAHLETALSCSAQRGVQRDKLSIGEDVLLNERLVATKLLLIR